MQFIEPHRVNAGMPKLEICPKRSVSPYEFMPTWFFYTPVIVQCLAQGIRYGDICLPLVANPSIELSGMVGESKEAILDLAGSYAKEWIEPFIALTKTEASLDTQVENALEKMETAGIEFPIVAKPDLGCRGVGVKLIGTLQQLEHYIEDFPQGARFLLQRKAPYEAEAGVFYVRYPGESKGKIISITLKYAPSVVGDGKRTLKALIEHCPRASQLSHLYFPRHLDRLDSVPAENEEVRLAFAGSHSRGSIFRDGNQYISQALTDKLDDILKDVDGYYYGRLDVKFENIQKLMQGEGFSILEMNGASSEATHIWDSSTPLKHIFATLLKQYRILFEIGLLNKKRGFKTPKLKTLLKAWRAEKNLVSHYPSTD
ncbi:D-alanine--D-alanine ligase [Marinomonas mediterranea]|uniref:D-alanine--D-alanine ligase n=1 Tax=Marinomonas mediterranea TaxID=119864 RepID=UPI00234B88D5|nr:D-alanine--D-alanine ligase [Marinomonas mediterranea]WCN07787.1 D-alanine--D-alanine ligase [Marinomonas mediterranea]